MAKKPWGIWEPGAPDSMSNVSTLAALVGSQPSYVQWFEKWAGAGANAYSATRFNNVLNYPAIPVLTWQPFDSAGITHVKNTDVTGGTYDTLINSYANGIKALSGTVHIRFAHEANGTWYDWSPGNNTNTYTTYIAMWQYVWNKFQAAGVTNVKWVWCMNRHFGSDSATYAQLYPGDAYVDIISLDGYNSGDINGHTWSTWAQMWTTSITDIVAVAPSKPLFINEIGCVDEAGQNKAAWLEDALGYQMQNDARITAWLYWDDINSGGPWDYRIRTSTEAQLAFTSSLVSTTSFNKF